MESESELITRTVLHRSTELSHQEAFQLLEKEDIATVAVPPVRPKAGEIYLFKPDKESNAGKLY